MHATIPLIKFYQTSHCDKFKKMAQPLADCLGIDVVMLTQISRNGTFFQANTFPSLGEFYWSEVENFNSNPFIRHPDFYDLRTMIMTDPPIEAYQNSQRSLKRFFNSEYVMGTFFREADTVYWIGYGTSDPSIHIASLFMHERYTLEKFSSHLLSKWKSYEANIETHEINICEIIGADFFKNSLQMNRSNSKTALLHKMGIEIPRCSFTNRERDCILHILKGKSASKIAEHLGLSNRTVENYISNIKDKAECDSKSTLIEKLWELDQLGAL